MTGQPNVAELLAGTVGRDWRTRAACLGVDPELFFPVAETGPAYDAQVAAAKTVCRGCPVRPECLAEAVARIPYGIAGGLTEDERRALRCQQGLLPVPGVEGAEGQEVAA